MTDDELRKLLADATPGPWRDGQEGNVRVYGPDGMAEHSGLIANVFKGRANARLIAAAPDLAAEVLRLRETEAALRAEVERLREALRDIARQRTTTELDAEGEAGYADFEVGYDACVAVARAALGDKEASHDR